MRRGDTVRVTVGMAEGMTGVVSYLQDAVHVTVQLEGCSYPSTYHINNLELVKTEVACMVAHGRVHVVFHGPFASEQSAKEWVEDQDDIETYDIVPLQSVD